MEVTILGLGGRDDGRCEEEAANYSWLLILCYLLRDEIGGGRVVEAAAKWVGKWRIS